MSDAAFSPRGLRRLKDRSIGYGLGAMAAISIVTTVGIILVLMVETFGFFREVEPWRLFTETQWTPLFAEKHFGIWPLMAGTLLTTFLAIIVAVPLGVLAAVYLSEYATQRVRRILKPLLELLAGVPTVVFGYFALMAVTPTLQKFVPDLSGFNALGPGLVMGIMILPVIASLSEDALHAVPRSLREASLALGADKLSTIFRVVVPAASSGIAAATILGISRAIGETMIVAIAAGQQPNLTADPRQPVETMTAYIVQVSLGDTPTGTLEYRTIFTVGMCLFVMTLGLNVVAFRLRRRIQRGGVL